MVSLCALACGCAAVAPTFLVQVVLAGGGYAADVPRAAAADDSAHSERAMPAWPVQRGMHFLGKSFEGTYAYDTPEALQSLQNMAQAGVTHVSFTFCWYVNVSTRSPPQPAPPSPPAPPCTLGQRLYNYSNTRPWSGRTGNPHGHENNAHVQLIGRTDTADACERACKASPSKNCTSWIWHNHDGTDWDGHCSKRSDGQWMPVPTKNDVSGRVNDTVFPPPPAPSQHGPLRWDTKVSFVDGVAPSGVIYANSSSPSDTELITIIAAAHDLNLTVKLRPTIDPRWESVPGCTELTASTAACPSRGSIHYSTAAEWDTFFAEGAGGYTDYIVHMARLAERTNCSILAVGVEVGAVMAQETHMRNLIAKVRSIFSGQLHSDIAGARSADFGLNSVKFWDAVDAVSLDSYPNLANSFIKIGDADPTVEQLMGGFQKYIDGMESFYNGSIGGNGSWTPKQAGLQIIWAEDGGCSYNNMYLHPGAFYHPAKPDIPCLSCQARYYEATLRTIFCNKQLRPWFGGVYWWKWSSDPDPWSHPREGTPYNHASGNNSDCELHCPSSSRLLEYA